MTVSVIMITYNHAKYIEQAIDGVLMQKTDFKVELIIANDCSTDTSDSIIKKKIDTITSRVSIQYYYHDKNKGIQPNFIFAFEKCQGNYIALCEGDDYWTDSLKLQKQVNFLEANAQYSYCSHQSMILKDGELLQKPTKTGIKTLEDVMNGNVLNTATLMFRKSAIENLPHFFNSVKAGDWILQFIALQHGDAYVLDDVMSVYRNHEQGLWSQLDKKKMGQLGVDTLKKAKQLFNKNKSITSKIDNAILKRQIEFGLYKESKWKRIKTKFLGK